MEYWFRKHRKIISAFFGFVFAVSANAEILPCGPGEIADRFAESGPTTTEFIRRTDLQLKTGDPTRLVFGRSYRDSNGQFIEVIQLPKSPQGEQFFELGETVDFARKFPEVTADYGFKVVDLPEGSELHVPSVDAFNVKLSRFDGTPHETPLRFEEVKGGHIDELDYYRAWSRGKLIQATEGRHHFHDRNVHSLGVALVPGKILKASFEQAKFVLRLVDDPRLSKNKALQEFIYERIIKESVDRIDTDSSYVASEIMSRKTQGDEALRAGILSSLLYRFKRTAAGSSEQEIANFILRYAKEYSISLSWLERRRIRQITSESQRTGGIPRVSDEEVEALSASVIRRF